MFEKFSRQLHLLKDNGLIDIELKYDETYICPLCLDQFQKSDLISDPNNNYLTEEDAPPDKLNGSRIALTCKTCNSKAGHEIDYHLIKILRDIDDSKFHKDTVQHRRVEFEDTFINSQITSEGDGILKVLHRIDNNNPTTLERFIQKLKTKSIGEILHLNPPKQPADNRKVNKALLKTNYIITFAKFGYIFLLDEFYDTIRKEIRNPDFEAEGNLMINQQFNNSQVGTYYVINPNSKSIFNIFSLKTDYSETIIGSLLPFPDMSPKTLHHNLTSKGIKLGNGEVGVTLDTTHYDTNADLFNNLNEIKKILAWKNAP